MLLMARYSNRQRAACAVVLEIFRGIQKSATLPWEYLLQEVHAVPTRACISSVVTSSKCAVAENRIKTYTQSMRILPRDSVVRIKIFCRRLFQHAQETSSTVE